MRAWAVALLLLILPQAAGGTAEVSHDGTRVLAVDSPLPLPAIEFDARAAAGQALAPLPPLARSYDEALAGWRLDERGATVSASPSRARAHVADEDLDLSLPEPPVESSSVRLDTAETYRALSLLLDVVVEELFGRSGTAMEGAWREVQPHADEVVRKVTRELNRLRITPPWCGEGSPCYSPSLGDELRENYAVAASFARAYLRATLHDGGRLVPHERVQTGLPRPVVEVAVETGPVRSAGEAASAATRAAANAALEAFDEVPDARVRLDVPDLRVYTSASPKTGDSETAYSAGGRDELTSEAEKAAADEGRAAFEALDPSPKLRPSGTLPLGGPSAGSMAVPARAAPAPDAPPLALGLLILAMLAVPAWLLSRRIGAADALENANRARVFALVAQKPAVTPAEVRDALGIHYTSVVHHLRMLEEAGHIRTERAQGRIRCFENGGRYDPVERATLAALRHPTVERLLRVLAWNAGIQQAHAARKAGIRRTLAKHHVDRLNAVGVVERERLGPRVRLRLAPAALDTVLSRAALPQPSDEPAPVLPGSAGL